MNTSFKQTRGAMPSGPSAVEIALEAGVTNERATAMIAASWHIAETWTNKNFWPVTAAEYSSVITATDPEDLWPRMPCPVDLLIEHRVDGEWVEDTNADYIESVGRIIGLSEGYYRYTQVGPVTPDDPGQHVKEAVQALALYQLIHSPARREFRTITAGDSTISREAVNGVIRASGAGILLAGEREW